jgi:hypothetical protein
MRPSNICQLYASASVICAICTLFTGSLASPTLADPDNTQLGRTVSELAELDSIDAAQSNITELSSALVMEGRKANGAAPAWIALSYAYSYLGDYNDAVGPLRLAMDCPDLSDKQREGIQNTLVFTLIQAGHFTDAIAAARPDDMHLPWAYDGLQYTTLQPTQLWTRSAGDVSAQLCGVIVTTADGRRESITPDGVKVYDRSYDQNLFHRHPAISMATDQKDVQFIVRLVRPQNTLAMYRSQFPNLPTLVNGERLGNISGVIVSGGANDKYAEASDRYVCGDTYGYYVFEQIAQASANAMSLRLGTYLLHGGRNGKVLRTVALDAMNNKPDSNYTWVDFTNVPISPK